MHARLVLALVMCLPPCLLASTARAENVVFSNATVVLVETRSDAWGSWAIVTLNDSSGNRIMRFCDTAVDKAAISLPLSDSSAKAVLAIALAANLSGKTVTGWGIEPPQGGQWCWIGNFAIHP